MQKMRVGYLFMLIVFLLISCSARPTEQTLEDITEEIVDNLRKGNYEDIYERYFSEKLKETFTLNHLTQNWEKMTARKGEFKNLGSLKTKKSGNHQVVEGEIEYVDVLFQLRLIFDDTKKIVGFNMGNGISNRSLPEHLAEEEVIVGAGSSYELGGTLTYPKKSEELLPAVVLVHGSGPSDRDESVYAYKPFRDIAWGLAEKGIAVLRYDKRTYTYGKQFAAEELKKFTVYEETVEDAIRASELLKKDLRIDSEQIFLIGHSLGGMLAPRIDEQGGNFAGVVMLAGSPRSLWEIISDQNMALLSQEDIDEKVKKEQERFVKEEFEKAKGITNLTDSEAMEQTVFGMPAYYFKEMDQFNQGELVLKSNKPYLILQGEDDFQVYAEKDFLMWKEILHNRANATLISFPGLNHFFIEYEGKDKGTVAEYEQPNVVNPEVITTVADWILTTME